MDLKRENPSVKVLAHLHDGNVLLVPQSEVETLMAQMASHVDRIGKGLKLGFPFLYQIVQPDSSWVEDEV